MTIVIPRFWVPLTGALCRGSRSFSHRLGLPDARIGILPITVVVAVAGLGLNSDVSTASTAGTVSAGVSGPGSATTTPGVPGDPAQAAGPPADLSTEPPAGPPPEPSVPTAAPTSVPTSVPVAAPSTAAPAAVRPGVLAAAAPAVLLPVTPTPGETTATRQLSASGIPARALAGYRSAASRQATRAPGCHLDWTLVAAIGRVESNHARFAGSGLTADGRATPPIYGLRLDGTARGTGLVRDSDGGALDGDAAYDRAVGPMQFLPGTWRTYAADGDGDGKTDPQDIDDAALAAAGYLCAGGADLSTTTGRWNAAYRYNHSTSYANLVVALATTYATGVPAAVATPPQSRPTTTVTVTVTPPRSTTTVTSTVTLPPSTSTPPRSTSTPPPSTSTVSSSSSSGPVTSSSSLLPTSSTTGPTSSSSGPSGPSGPSGTLPTSSSSTIASSAAVTVTVTVTVTR